MQKHEKWSNWHSCYIVSLNVLQLMYFFYGVGAFLSPLIEEPFLSDTDCDRFGFALQRDAPAAALQYVPLNATHVLARDPLAAVHGANSSLLSAQARPIYTSKVRYAFWIFALIQLLSPALVAVLFVKSGCAIYNNSPPEESGNSDSAANYDDRSLGGEILRTEKSNQTN